EGAARSAGLEAAAGNATPSTTTAARTVTVFTSEVCRFRHTAGTFSCPRRIYSVVRMGYMEPALRRRLLAALAVGLVVVVLAARHFSRGGGTPAAAQAHPVLAADAAASPRGKIVVH